MQALSYLVSLGSFVCFIMVLIKLFKEKGALHGILGILSCGLYPLIWGWIHNGRLGIKNIMIIWTVLIVVGIILNVVVGAAAVSAASHAQ
ncbi:MAG: hypothetical protein ABJF10_25990 [Chthoniobacter sp.]|uniref:hypothetical protein n=1 Tax=Chthoniobacter sp. TaxID=2510640 RepID=UPI0032AE2887